MILFFYQLALFVIDLVQFIWKALILIVYALISLVFPPAAKNIHGEIVLITGGGHGLGKELAFHFAKHGAKIVVWDINEVSVNENNFLSVMSLLY